MCSSVPAWVARCQALVVPEYKLCSLCPRNRKIRVALGQHRAMRALTGGRRGDMNYLSRGLFWATGQHGLLMPASKALHLNSGWRVEAWRDVTWVQNSVTKMHVYGAIDGLRFSFAAQVKLLENSSCQKKR